MWVPYRTFADDEDLPRPYLVLLATGINGESGSIPGLVDSGADSTSLPFEYAALMGYDESNLVEEEFGQVEGTFTGHRATEPFTAVVPEIPDVTIEIYPAFIQNSDTVLWGRMDFMKHFQVTVNEPKQQFAIQPIIDLE